MKPIKVKIFTHCSRYINPHNEIQINEWLAEHPDIEIVSLVQSESMAAIDQDQIERNLSISIFYRQP
jgi:hypothetical protein